MTVEHIVHGGEGLVRIGGKVGFVADVLPGEFVRIAVTAEWPRRFRGKLITVLEPSNDRVTPICPHFGDCGGCEWQHIAYERQIDLKKSILVEDLRRIGKTVVSADSVIVEESEPWEYRGRVQIHTDAEQRSGFKARGVDRIVPVTNCPVARPRINEVLARGRTLRKNSRTVVVENGDSAPRTSCTFWDPDNAKRHLSATNQHAGEPSSPTEPNICDERATRVVNGNTIEFHSGAFFQSNFVLIDRLARVIGEKVSTQNPESIVDLYSGAGLLAVAASSGCMKGSGTRSASTTTRPESIENLDATDCSTVESRNAIYPKSVICVESDRRNAQYVQKNLERSGVNSRAITVVMKRVEHAIRNDSWVNRITPEATVLILDPPREGLSLPVRRWILRTRFSHLFYLSCDSAALARDIRELQGSYALEEVRLFDFYPQTSHIETLVELSLRDRIVA